MAKVITTIVILGVLLILVGCPVPHRVLPTDPSNPLKRVAVLPLKNDTADVDGPALVRKKMVQALENHSYVVKDVKETDQILRDQMGINLGGQLELTTPQMIGETLGVEGVLYGTLMDFDETTTGIINVRKVRAKFQLVNTSTGQTMWERGLGVRSEMMMQGHAGLAGAVVSRSSDARDKEVPWVTIQSTTTGSNKVGESFAIGLGTKLLSKAIGVHLDYESAELARRVTDNLPWGPGAFVATSSPVPKFGVAEIKAPEPPSFAYMEWEGKRDFSAVVFSTTIDKKRNEPLIIEFPISVAGKKMRMDMDLSRMVQGDAQSPIGNIILIKRGDKKTGYTLYPEVKRYMVHPEKEGTEERPVVKKTRVGSETLEKYRTDKYKVRIMYKDGKVEEGFVWNARELKGMTIRGEVENNDYRTTTELRSIVLKTPPASLFEIPDGYGEAKSFMEVISSDPKNR
jgi:hypothetical protein